MIHIQGDGGHAKVVRDVLQYYQHLGEKNACVAIGDNTDRRDEYHTLQYEGYLFPSLQHPTAVVSSQLGEGTIVMANAVVQPGCRIGRMVIINTGATVDHDCVVDDFAHIAPGVHLCGGVHVGEGALVGVGSCAVPGAKIPAWSLVKAGSVVK